MRTHWNGTLVLEWVVYKTVLSKDGGRGACRSDVTMDTVKVALQHFTSSRRRYFNFQHKFLFKSST